MGEQWFYLARSGVLDYVYQPNPQFVSGFSSLRLDIQSFLRIQHGHLTMQRLRFAQGRIGPYEGKIVKQDC